MNARSSRPFTLGELGHYLTAVLQELRHLHRLVLRDRLGECLNSQGFLLAGRKYQPAYSKSGLTIFSLLLHILFRFLLEYHNQLPACAEASAGRNYFSYRKFWQGLRLLLL